MSRMSDFPHICQIFTLFWYGKNKIESVLPAFIRKYSSVPCFTWKRGSIGSKSDSLDMSRMSEFRKFGQIDRFLMR